MENTQKEVPSTEKIINTMITKKMASLDEKGREKVVFWGKWIIVVLLGIVFLACLPSILGWSADTMSQATRAKLAYRQWGKVR